MSFLDLAKKRYSVRKYKKIPVEEEKLEQILEAGRVAPSAVNHLPEGVDFTGTRYYSSLW